MKNIIGIMAIEVLLKKLTSLSLWKEINMLLRMGQLIKGSGRGYSGMAKEFKSG